MKKLLLLLAAMASLLCMTPAVASAAYNPFGSDICGRSGTDTSKSAVCSSKTTGNPIAGPNGLIVKITNLIAYIAGVAAVIMILVAGIKFITSSGDSNGINSAKQTILYTMLGIVVIIIARSLVVYVVSRI